MKAFLILEDGHVFEGISIGSKKEIISEIVFTTSMTGYLETLTDPSNAGLTIVMTYPLIGNYGICRADMESDKAWPSGLVIREASRKASNFRAEGTIEEFLYEQDVTGIMGIDTRALTKLLRESGTMYGMITVNAEFILEEVLLQIKSSAGQEEDGVSAAWRREKRLVSSQDFMPSAVEEAKMTYMASAAMKDALYEAEEKGVCGGLLASCAMQGDKGLEKLLKLSNDAGIHQPKRIALYDFGGKKSIVHSLLKRGCDIEVLPPVMKADDVIKERPDGILLSSGPGNPLKYPELIEEAGQLFLSGIPIFAISFGHLLIALANGFQIEKLNCGHRGSHPVKDMETGSVYLSAQNHGYVVTKESIDIHMADILFLNANDKTVEGLRYKKQPVLTVQFHPESSAGPLDTEYLFDIFMDMISEKLRGD